MGATNIIDQNANNLGIVAGVLEQVSNVAENVSESFISVTAALVDDVSFWPNEALDVPVSRLAALP